MLDMEFTFGLKDKGHDEKHSQSKYFILHHMFNYRHYQILVTDPLQKLSTNPLTTTSDKSQESIAYFSLFILSFEV